jgi:signal transduction histidine kinase
MSETDHGPVSRLEAARLHIVQLKLEESDDLRKAATAAARVSARTLGIARVGIWFLSPSRLELHRVVSHDELPRSGATDATLPLERWPAYLDAILSRRVVAADDARTDPRTRELLTDYLEPLGIGAMLDAPLFLGGEVWGVVCHEHVGGPRPWSEREVDFSVSVADMLSALLEQSMRIATEKRLRAEEVGSARARQAEAVARTAAGIGHDVNTVLAAILGSAELARRAKDEGAWRSAVDAIVEDCRRGARIVNQLRELEITERHIGAMVDLAVVTKELVSTLEALLSPEHTLVTELADGAIVPATRTDIERILLNLVVNARDSMVKGGIVAVRVAVSGEHVELSVSDQGAGIDPEDREHVFEPYFTTKGATHGGLGLFAVQAIGIRTGGVVSLDSRVGRGTEIKVRWRTLDGG